MRLKSKIAAALLGSCRPSGVAAWAAIIGGTYYAPQYDYREFFAAADGRNFQVILAGNAFPGVDPDTVARDLLPVMQAAKPRPALTFTYDGPGRKAASLLPAGADLRSRARSRLELGVRWHDAALQAGRPGVFYVFAVYCRNDQVMSETTAWIQATGPNDPRIGELFRELFQVVFTDSPAYGRNLNGRGGMRN